jgi:hypothetical protein
MNVELSPPLESVDKVRSVIASWLKWTPSFSGTLESSDPHLRYEPKKGRGGTIRISLRFEHRGGGMVCIAAAHWMPTSLWTQLIFFAAACVFTLFLGAPFWTVPAFAVLMLLKIYDYHKMGDEALQGLVDGYSSSAEALIRR